jgi:hypothetical protein
MAILDPDTDLCSRCHRPIRPWNAWWQIGDLLYHFACEPYSHLKLIKPGDKVDG